MKLSKFIAESGLNASLVRSTVRQCGDWQSFQEMAQDVANHGANAGFGNFIYYTDTIAFAKRNKKAILETIKDDLDYYKECDSVPAFISESNCVDLTTDQVAIALYTGKGEDVTGVYNALAFYALEEVARRYCDIIESNE